MFTHLLIATDGSPVAATAARTALALAKACDASVTALHVIEPFRATTYGQMMVPHCETIYLDQARLAAGHCLGGVENMAGEAGVPCAPVYEVSSPIHRTIEDVAHTRGCDLIVTGSHGYRGLQRLILGSETQKILLTTDLPVLVCSEPSSPVNLDRTSTDGRPEQKARAFKKMLLVIDASEGASRCASRSMELAVTLGCAVQALYVMSPLPAVGRIADAIEGDSCRNRVKGRAQAALDDIAATAEARGVSLVVSHVVDNRYDVAILDQAKHGGCDLIVMHGHARDARSLRNVARDVILNGEIPVLIFP